MHRVTVTDEHYDMVRQYMVATKLPHVRAAVEAAEEGEKSLQGAKNGRNSREGMKGPGIFPTPSHMG